MQQENQNPHNLTREQVLAGIEQLKEWYPEESEKIDKYKETVLAHVVDKAEIPVNHPIWSEEHVQRPEVAAVEVTISPCMRQIAGFTTEGVTFVATVAGAVTAARFKTAIERGILSILGPVPEYEREITPLLNAFHLAEGNWAKAQAFAPIAYGFWKRGLLRTGFDAIKKNSSYADWLMNGSVALAQILIWVGSEFIAAVAEIAIIILSALHLISTAKEAVAVCSI